MHTLDVCGRLRDRLPAGLAKRNALEVAHAEMQGIRLRKGRQQAALVRDILHDPDPLELRPLQAVADGDAEADLEGVDGRLPDEHAPHRQAPNSDACSDAHLCDLLGHLAYSLDCAASGMSRDVAVGLQLQTGF